MRALLAALLACGCAGTVMRPPPQIALIVEDSSAPFEYRADVAIGRAAREVHGEACRNAVGFPLFLYGGYDLVGWADAGYRDAVAQAQAQAPEATLTDIRADIRFVNILVFRRECLEITASAR